MALDAEMERLRALPVFGDGPLAARRPELKVRRARARPNRLGFAVPAEFRLSVTAYPGIRPGDVLETLLHELTHLHVGRAAETHAWHGRTFKVTLARAMEEAYGLSAPAPRSTRHGAYAEALERSLPGAEDPDFLREQLVTYIGNKRSLLGPIQAATERVTATLGRRPVALDAFAGSGVVSRLFKSQASRVVANDLEPYARVLAECFLANAGEVPWGRLRSTIASLNASVDLAPAEEGFIERLYAPDDDDRVAAGERVFYTRENARRLDLYSRMIREADRDLEPYLLGPLLSSASVHANTAGVFKGFYKDRETGVGKFGGSASDALTRIKGTIGLRAPVLSRYSGDFEVLQHDANDLPDLIEEVDLAYLDPPYNQHPYGSNYFMLNLLVDYTEPTKISDVSGIPTDWRRSGYNVRKRSEQLFGDLVTRLPARFLLVSFNDEGFIAPAAMHSMLREVGRVEEFRTTYNAYRGSRNLANRNLHVTEHLYLVDRDG